MPTPSSPETPDEVRESPALQIGRVALGVALICVLVGAGVWSMLPHGPSQEKKTVDGPMTDVSKLDLPGKIAARQKDVDRFSAQAKSLDAQIVELTTEKATAGRESGASQQATAAQLAAYRQAKAKRDAAQARYDHAREREASARAALAGDTGPNRDAIRSRLTAITNKRAVLAAQPDAGEEDPTETNAERLQAAREAVDDARSTLNNQVAEADRLKTQADGAATGSTEQTTALSAWKAAEARCDTLRQQLLRAQRDYSSLRRRISTGASSQAARAAEIRDIDASIAALKRQLDAPAPDRGGLQAALAQATQAAAAARADLAACPVPVRPSAGPSQARIEQIAAKIAAAVRAQKGVQEKLAQANADLRQFQSMQRLSQK
ncbi:MAG TPA: hypothetical protein VKT77_02190 [Chthonomonadaceae bacterium]|nr:hypothetical protein [Chthonomonadaceae bacterium]